MIYILILFAFTLIGMAFSFTANAQPNPSNTKLWTTNASTQDTNVIKMPTGSLFDSVFNKIGNSYTLSGLNSVRQWYPAWLIQGLSDSLAPYVKTAVLGTAIVAALGYTPYNATANPNGFISTLPTTGIAAGTYGILTVNTFGVATAGKRTQTYTGTTDASGNYTVTFGTAYSVAPNIQASLSPQAATNQYIRITSISTTGFTVNAYSFNTNNLLGIVSLITTTSNLVGATADVLITEK